MQYEKVLDHETIVQHIIEKEFCETPRSIQRMTVGTTNEVYCVGLSTREVIVRLNADADAMKSAETHIALFKEKGISVPEVLAADYSQDALPLAYQIQSKLEGRDIGQVISTLSDGQIKAVAREIAAISKKLLPLQTNGKYGWSGGSVSAEHDSWWDVMQMMYITVRERNAITGAVGEKYVQIMEDLLETSRPYYESVASVFYYDDMSSKNVLVHDGSFMGVVDLDTVVYGDPLEGIGRIEASWYGTSHGRLYADTLFAELGLTADERATVSVYAVLNKIFWLAERGIRLNHNTSTIIDWEAVAEDKHVIDMMMRDSGL